MDRNGSKSSNDSNIDQTIGSHQWLITSGEALVANKIPKHRSGEQRGD